MSKIKQLIATMCVCAFSAAVSNAGEIDMLIKMLAEKDVITYGEAAQLMTETAEQVKADLAAGKHAGAPKWSQRLSFKGDIRLRHQTEKIDTGVRRDRGRIRYRLGLNANVSPGFTASAGLCTGSSDSRSTNQTMQDNFSTKSIMLDYVYVTYSPAPELTLYGGKFGIGNALWTASDLIWDTDLAPEGVNARYSKRHGKFGFFGNAGYYLMDENGSATDVLSDGGTSIKKDPAEPYMYILQAGMSYKINSDTSVKAAPTKYGFGKIKNYTTARFANTSGTNTTKSSSTATTATKFYKYDYNATGLDLEFDFTIPLLFMPAGRLYATYIANPDPDEENKGYLGGIRVGKKSVSSFGDWQARYMYRQLETDAFLDMFPDSDAYGGKTNYLGHEIIFAFGLAKNVNLGLNYYETRPKTGTKDNNGQKTQKLMQTDIIVKF